MDSKNTTAMNLFLRYALLGLSTTSLVLTAVRPTAAETEASASPSPHAVEAIRLLDDKDSYQRQVGFLRLEALREPATVPIVMKYLESPDPDTRGYSLRALAAIDGARAVPLLLGALSTDRHPTVRRAALLGLEPLYRTDPQIVPAFIKALRDAKTEVRITAVDIVSRIDDPTARDAILRRNKRERRRDVRRALDLAMKRLKGS